MSRKNIIATFFILTSILLPKQAFAVGSAGFENAAYSAKTIGQANAVVARPQDPSTVSFNPAGLVELPGIQVNAGGYYMDWTIFHHNDVQNNDIRSTPLLLLIPTFYISANPGEILDNRVAFGLGVNSPFGSANRWNARDPFGHNGFDNELRMAATTMAAAYRVTDWMDIGAGATNYYVFDYGQKLTYPNAAILQSPGTPDGEGWTNTRGFAWGWNFGILLKPRPHHNFGFSYRSRANVDVHGRVAIQGIVSGASQGFTTFPDFETAIGSDIPLPQNYTWGYAYIPSDDWSVELDLGYTNWGDFSDMDFGFNESNAVLESLGSIPRDYQDTISVHLGGHRRISKKWDFYAGTAFYSAASPQNHVDNFLPDSHRFSWALGTTYSLTDRFDIDVAYFFQLFGKRRIHNPGVLSKTGDNIDGTYFSTIHVLFVSATYKFDFPFEKKSKTAALDASNPAVTMK